MAKYTGTILTNKGKELLVRAILGEVIVFTKVEIGKGILPLGTDKENLTSLIDSFKILSITSTTNLPNGGYRIRISFNNKGFIDDTYLREVGIYARGEDGIEILYSYCNTDTPNLIPNEASGVIESIEDIITYISNAATINAVIDQSNVYATIKDLVEGLATKEDKFNKNGAFNKKFGTIVGTVMEGNKRATDLGGEVAFNKNSGFNKNKSDVVNSDDSNTVATSKAVKTAYDRGSSGVTKADNAQNSANSAQTKANQAYTLADGKEPKFNKGNAFNKNFSHVISSTSKILVASAYAVKLAYDRGSLGVTNASTAQTKADNAYNLANGKEPTFIKNNGFNRVMTNLVTSTSTILVASAAAVRIAYNKGLEALGLTVINKNAIQNNTEQIENLIGTRHISLQEERSFTIPSDIDKNKIISITALVGKDNAGYRNTVSLMWEKEGITSEQCENMTTLGDGTSEVIVFRAPYNQNGDKFDMGVWASGWSFRNVIIAHWN